VVGNRTRVKVVKNKCSAPFKQAEFDIMYGKGISREGSLLDVAVELGFIKKSGAWFTYEGEQLGQGRENVKTFLSRTRSSWPRSTIGCASAWHPRWRRVPKKGCARPRRPSDLHRQLDRTPLLSQRRAALSGIEVLRADPATPSGDLPGALRVRMGHGDLRMEAADLSGCSIRGPTVPFRYLPPKQSVRMAFNVILDREPDAAVAPSTPRKLARGELSRHGVAQALAHSEEFRRQVPIGDVLLSMHVSRSEFVAGLPRAARILDLGGTHQGWPTARWSTWGIPTDSSASSWSICRSRSATRSTSGGRRAPRSVRARPGGVRLPLHGGSEPLRRRSFDLVYSGQSIEHVTESEGDTVMREVFRVLAPGGWFCLDTPNGPVWRLRSAA
jgi:hypothetical protein